MMAYYIGIIAVMAAMTVYGSPISASTRADNAKTTLSNVSLHHVNVSIDMNDNNAGFTVTFTYDHQTVKNSVVRWKRVGCDRMMEDNFVECDTDDDDVYMAVMKNSARQNHTYTARSLTYNSRYWVEMTSGGRTSHRFYFFTPACLDTDVSMTMCQDQIVKEKHTKHHPSLTYVTAVLWSGVVVALVVLVTVIVKRNKQLQKNFQATMESVRHHRDNILGATSILKFTKRHTDLSYLATELDLGNAVIYQPDPVEAASPRRGDHGSRWSANTVDSGYSAHSTILTSGSRQLVVSLDCLHGAPVTKIVMKQDRQPQEFTRLSRTPTAKFGSETVKDDTTRQQLISSA